MFNLTVSSCISPRVISPYTVLLALGLGQFLQPFKPSSSTEAFHVLTVIAQGVLWGRGLPDSLPNLTLLQFNFKIQTVPGTSLHLFGKRRWQEEWLSDYALSHCLALLGRVSPFSFGIRQALQTCLLHSLISFQFVYFCGAITFRNQQNPDTNLSRLKQHYLLLCAQMSSAPFTAACQGKK